jgi:hypothetical protein
MRFAARNLHELAIAKNFHKASFDPFIGSIV